MSSSKATPSKIHRQEIKNLKIFNNRETDKRKLSKSNGDLFSLLKMQSQVWDNFWQLSPLKMMKNAFFFHL